jgi:PPK2 family polyphosphate:nucleotide phosphotransferase
MTEARRFVQDLVRPLRVEPGTAVNLQRDYDPHGTGRLASREEAEARLEEGVGLLADYQDRLSAQDVYGVLLILQGLDASGKDSTIKHVMSGVNPQGVEVRSFKKPSAEELSRDFLWRYQAKVPGRGQIGIFNRSHYEEVLVVRVHPELLDAQRLPRSARDGDLWKSRYRQINDWERHLVENGIRVVKVFLNLSKEEQARRFLRRIDDPTKNWKFSPSDVYERRFWDQYQEAFEQMLSHTSTKWAPWHVVPADHKWFTRLATGAVLLATLAEIDPHYPDVAEDIRREMASARGSLVEDGGREPNSSRV